MLRIMNIIGDMAPNLFPLASAGPHPIKENTMTILILPKKLKEPLIFVPCISFNAYFILSKAC